MFTVCPKCALTLVVTAQDLRVAQGYVRCGRCSNVFNAIVGLTDDRGALASQAAQAGGNPSPGTATTSIIRKAPSISDDAPAEDTLADTGETEAVYAEPDPAEVKFQEVFIEPPPPPSTPTRGPVKFVAPPPGPPVRAQPTPPAKAPPQKRAPEPEKRYSDTEGIDTYSENELEFNPDLTDVTKVFVEAAPVTFRNNAATGQFEKIVLGADGEPARPARSAPTNQSAASAPSSPANSAPAATQGVGLRRNNGASAPAAPPPRPTATAPATPAAKQATTAPPKPSAPAARATREAPPREAPVRQPPPPPPVDDEEDQLANDLRTLAAQLDSTSNRPAPKFEAANDAAIAAESGASATGSFARTSRFTEDEEAEDEGAIGDIYAKAKPRPPAPRDAGIRRNTGSTNSGVSSMALANDAEMEVGAAESITPASSPRGRYFPYWVAGAIVLGVALIAQTINHNRHDLATNAFLNRPLTKLYGALGVPLVPNWDLAKYDVRQLGASTSEAGQGTLTVRASLKNTADQPLPLPLLRIVMQDRYGNRVATRDVPPTGYVPGAVPAEAHLGVGQRIDAEMTFKDPGQDAVGFEIDACLPTASGRITCANDAAVAPR